jgi:hypothetical protein
MLTNPGMTADLATQDRELTSTPARPTARRVVASLAVAVAAAAVLMTSPVGGAHYAAGVGAHYAAGVGAHYAAGVGHYF